MPKTPRDLSGKELVALLKRYDYLATRQTGSHIRLTSSLKGLPSYNDTKPYTN